MAIKIPKPMITKEHGSWAVLLVPIVIAAGRAGAWKPEGTVIVAAMVAAFFTYLPAQTLLRHAFGSPQPAAKLASSVLWGSLSFALAGSLMVYLILSGYIALIAICAIALVSFLGNFLLAMRIQKPIVGDLVGMAGLTLGAPALYYVNSGVVDAEAVSLYLLSFLFFGCSVVYVHMKIRVVEMRKDDLSLREKLSAARLNVLYHIAVLGIVIVLAVWHWTPALSAIAFIPMTVHALYGTYTLSTKVRFKRLGILLVAHSLLFALLLLIVPGN